MDNVGVVVIGRNEGEQLRLCLASLAGGASVVVYVDSGSTDGSVALAQSMGCDVVELDPAVPFTAARARNAGFRRLCELVPDVEIVQFVDGDCELLEGWIERGVRDLGSRPRVAVICGRLRERYRDASIFNRLCDMEWKTTLGEVEWCGGIAMMRAEALRNAGGFRSGLIGGEEPELCVRLLKAGWTILRIDADMALHDAAMTRFSQWWKRAVRSGYGYAEGARLHGASIVKYNVRAICSCVLWAMTLPVLALGLIWATQGLSLLLLLAYPLKVVHMMARHRNLGWSWGDCGLYATFTMVAKFAQLIGMASFAWRCVRGRCGNTVEHEDGMLPDESAGRIGGM